VRARVLALTPLANARAPRAPDLAPLYVQCCERLGWTLDTAKLHEMQGRNAQTLKELDDRCAPLPRRGGVSVRARALRAAR
jgi:hypothetical protein